MNFDGFDCSMKFNEIRPLALEEKQWLFGLELPRPGFRSMHVVFGSYSWDWLSVLLFTVPDFPLDRVAELGAQPPNFD